MTHGVKKTFYLGDINQDGHINQEDYDLLADYIADKSAHPLTTYQKQLADVNQSGGDPDVEDLACMEAFLNGKPVEQPDGSYIIPADELAKCGYTGIQTASTIETLSGFVVKLYILRTDEYDSNDEEFDDSYKAMILSDLQEYKILPLTIEIDLHSINKYYWSIQGKFFTKEPISRDELQTIIVTINNNLRYNYSVDKINFNTIINYKEVIETILAVDSRILMVDLDPIKYFDDEGNEISKEQLTGTYTQVIPRLTNSKAVDNLHYSFKLEHTPILPRFFNDKS